jgi:hypothetical protein
MADLARLAELIKARNRTEVEIAVLVGRPAQIGHLGEYIASQMFDIKLHDSASRYGSDGVFASGPLMGRTVDIKWYAMNESILDLHPEEACDYYLVMTGPKPSGSPLRGAPRPWLICNVYLFHTSELLAALQARGIRVGIATSIRRTDWDAAEIYSRPSRNAFRLNEAQRQLLAIFG